jgi:hypothetical protein
MMPKNVLKKHILKRGTNRKKKAAAHIMTGNFTIERLGSQKIA